jgi:mannonate dehydratase
MLSRRTVITGVLAAPASPLAIAQAQNQPADGPGGDAAPWMSPRSQRRNIAAGMYVGTQINPRDDADYRVWAQLGVRHVCVDPPGNPHHWSLDDLNRHREHVESFGLWLDMVQLPLSSRPIEDQESPHILMGKEPERQHEIDSICGLIERLARAGIPAAKYNLNIIGIPRTEREPGRGGSRNAAFRWSRVDHGAPPTMAGVVSEEENWERIEHFLAAVVPVATAAKVRLACHPHDPYTPPGFRGVTRVLGTVDGLKRFVQIHESPYHRLNFCQGTIAEMLPHDAARARLGRRRCGRGRRQRRNRRRRSVAPSHQQFIADPKALQAMMLTRLPQRS